MVDPLASSIIPGVGAGGILLGELEHIVIDKLGEPKSRVEFSSGVSRLTFDGIRVWLNKSNVVSQICLIKGYTGCSQEGVGIGITKSELKDLLGFDLAYNEVDNYWEFLSHPGFLFEFSKGENGVERVSAIYLTK
jgi:hypothetical protein